MSEETVNIEGAVCAPPLPHSEQIVMGHGAGGRMSHQLIQKAFISAFQNSALQAGDDAAMLQPVPGMQLSISTDAHVVTPLFFPGGDIGRLAVCGTVNDVAMLGAKPLYLTAGFILEEGLEMNTLQRVIASMQAAAAQSSGRRLWNFSFAPAQLRRATPLDSGKACELCARTVDPTHEAGSPRAPVLVDHRSACSEVRLSFYRPSAASASSTAGTSSRSRSSRRRSPAPTSSACSSSR